MGLLAPRAWVLLAALLALGFGAAAARGADEPPTGAPDDTITPLVFSTTRPPEISVSHGYFYFYVGAPMRVVHTLRYKGNLLGRRTVDCPSGRGWRVRVDFNRAGRRKLQRLLRNHRDDELRWKMVATDKMGNVAHQTVKLYR